MEPRSSQSNLFLHILYWKTLVKTLDKVVHRYKTPLATHGKSNMMKTLKCHQCVFVSLVQLSSKHVCILGTTSSKHHYCIHGPLQLCCQTMIFSLICPLIVIKLNWILTACFTGCSRQMNSYINGHHERKVSWWPLLEDKIPITYFNGVIYNGT